MVAIPRRRQPGSAPLRLPVPRAAQRADDAPLLKLDRGDAGPALGSGGRQSRPVRPWRKPQQHRHEDLKEIAMADDIAFLPATELLARYRAKTLSPVAVIEETLSRLETYEGALNAFVLYDPASALAA